MALQAAGGMGGGLMASGGMGGGMTLAPVQQGPKFAAPSGAKAQQRAPSSSTGTAYLNLDASIRAARAEPDKSCLSVELDGGSFTTAFCNESGATAKLLTGSDGDRMPAVVGVPVPAAGLLAHWVDKRSPNERGAALPVGVVVGGSAQAGKVSAPSAGVGKDGNKDGKAGGVEALQVLGGFGRLLGRDSSDPETKLHAFKHNGSSIKLKPRKLHAARARVGILGYDSDDEVDETDGGERVYPGSKLCFELKAATRQGTMHVLPEELLALSLVELKARAATKLGGGDKDKESRVKAAAAAGAGANLLAGAGQDVDKEEGEPPCAFDPKAPRAVSLVVPCCWADSERTAASTAAKMVGLEVRLVSSSLATAAGALLGDAGGSGSEPIASFPGLGGGSGGSGGGKGGQKLPAGAVASAVRAALQKTKTQQGEGDVEDTEGGVGAALVLVLNGGHDSIEASLVKVTGLLPGDEGEVGGGALGWVRRLTALKSRGCAHGAAAGINDVLTAAPTSADAKTVAALAKAAASYEGNGIVSSGGGGKGKGAASGNGGAGAESESSALLQPLRATLLSCVKAVLSAEPSSSVTGAAKPAPKAKLACVVARGALFGGGGASLIGGVMDDLAACLQAASASGSGLFLEAAKAEEVPFFVLPQDAAVKGAAALAAAEGRLPKSPFAQKQKQQEEVAAPAGGGEDNGEEAKDEDGGGGEDEAKGSSGKEDKKKKKKEKENEVAEKAKKEKAKKSKDKGGKLVACDSLQWALGVAHSDGSSPCASQEATKATKAGKRVPRSVKWGEAMGGGGGGGGGCGKASESSGVVGVDLLFARDSVVPCQASRTYSASTLKEALGVARAHASALTGAKGLCLTVVEQTPNTTTTAATTAGAGGSSSPAEFLRLQPLGNPLVRTNEELEKEKGVTVTLNFEVDASGLLEISSEAFVSEKEEDLAKHSKRSFFQRYMWILFGLLLVASGFGFQLSQVWGEWQREAAVEAGRHTARANALKAYYKDINPAKVGSIDAALDAHKDNYRALWEKLEKKYGKKPPKPDYLGQRKSQNSRKEL